MAEPKVIIPVITPDLITYLSTIYPDRSPNPGDTLDLIRFASGQVSVVRHLKYLMDEQSKNILKG